MMFIKKAPNSHGWVNPRDVEDLWKDQFNYFYREEEEFVFPVTVHPDVCGHPHGLFMLERYGLPFSREVSRFEELTFSTGSSNTSIRMMVLSGRPWSRSVTISNRRTSRRRAP